MLKWAAQALNRVKFHFCFCLKIDFQTFLDLIIIPRYVSERWRTIFEKMKIFNFSTYFDSDWISAVGLQLQIHNMVRKKIVNLKKKNFQNVSKKIQNFLKSCQESYYGPTHQKSGSLSGGGGRPFPPPCSRRKVNLSSFYLTWKTFRKKFEKIWDDF